MWPLNVTYIECNSAAYLGFVHCTDATVAAGEYLVSGLQSTVCQAVPYQSNATPYLYQAGQ
jgi:hypothetical protein